MATTNTPTNQKYLNISFALDDGAGGVSFFTLPIRPEELTRVEPSRVSVVNSLDGAWVDSFGRGLTNLTISGNTGWRTKNSLDGIGQFTKLRDEFIHKWHSLRQDRVSNGKDPSDVRLIYVDSVNGSYVADVVPMQFTLRRSKSQPLLLTYNLSMTVTNDKAVPPADDGSYDLLEDKRLKDKTSSLASVSSSITTLQSIQTSLESSLATIGSFGASVHNWTESTFSPVMTLANEIIKTADETKAVISESGAIAVTLANDLSAVGTKLWAAVASVANLPNAVLSQVMQIKSAFSNLNCVLSNGYENAMTGLYESSDYYGSSNCSSTAGGRSSSIYVGVNSFETATTNTQQVSVSTNAVTAIKSITASDPISTIDTDQLTLQVDQMNSGVSCLT